MNEQLQISVELPVEAVKAYVQGEKITPYNFDLLQNYFEGRIIKLLETNTPDNFGLTTLIMNWVVAGGNDPTVQDCADFAGEVIALIKGEN